MSDVGKVHVDSMVQKASGSDWVSLSRWKAFHAGEKGPGVMIRPGWLWAGENGPLEGGDLLSHHH